jgi:RES domain-containing protein
MGERIVHVPVQGAWSRHVRAGEAGLETGRGGRGGRFHRPGQLAVYLADSDATAWAEWYRWLAEQAYPPDQGLPRDLHRIAVDLDTVIDLSSGAARKAAGVPERLRPAQSQWAASQQRADRWRANGAQGVLYSSAARTRSLCLCVFDAGLHRLRIDGEPVRVLAPPPPPRGLRT